MAARRLHILIYATVANCCLFLVVCSIALGTNKWFSSEAETQPLKTTVSYGLFSGKKIKTPVAAAESEHPLKLVCKGSKCMFSCGLTGEKRKQEVEELAGGNCDYADYIYCTEEIPTRNTGAGRNSSLFQVECTGENTEFFLSFGLYLATIAFLVLGMVFAIASGVLALYNTYRTPIQPVLSVTGLYAWNGTAALFVLLSMIMWTVEFATRLRKNAGISETLSGAQDSSGNGALGISFWILILAICSSIANIVILKYRSWKIIKMEEKNVRVMSEKLESGDIILF